MELQKVFISHSSKDAKVARALVDELEARSVKCWIDKRDIAPGTDWDESIISAIMDCRALIVLVSSDSIASKPVRSEVVLASSKGKPIYPVRLIDVEVAGGLQFHLELSQWVDLFPNPTAESYDRLAQAILTGSRVKPVVRRGPDLRRWAVYSALGAVALAVAVLVGEEAIGRWQVSQFEAEFAAQQAADAAAETARVDAAMKLVDLTPSFSLRGGKVYLQSVLRKDFPPLAPPTRTGVSVNGGPLEILPDTFWNHDFGLPPAEIHSLVLKVLAEDGTVFRVLDKTAALRAALAPLVKTLRDRLNYPGGMEVVCRIDGCILDPSVLCDPAVLSVTMEGEGKTLPIPTYRCNQPTETQTICLPAQELPFPLIPGQPAVFNFSLLDGSRIRIERPVGATGSPDSDLSFVRLLAAPGNEGAPSLFYSYDHSEWSPAMLKFFLGWKTCPEKNAADEAIGSLTVFGDVDGKGLLEDHGGHFAGAPVYFIPFDPASPRSQSDQIDSTQIARQKTVSFALGTSKGIVHGPWTYKFDLAKTFGQSLPPNDIPKIICSDDGDAEVNWGTDNRNSCNPRNPERFFDVAAIEFGEQSGQPAVTLPVSFSADDYLAGRCSREDDHCPLSFEIPEGWKGIYTRVVLKSGEKLLEVRHNPPKL